MGLLNQSFSNNYLFSPRYIFWYFDHKMSDSCRKCEINATDLYFFFVRILFRNKDTAIIYYRKSTTTVQSRL